jgi:TonB-dependent starch-binding outer membrane protein SusC
MKTMYQKLLLLLLLLPFSALAQSTASGTVRDNTTGEPLAGVSVIVEGTTNGTSTDMDGNYSLPNVKSGDRLVFSMIGYSNVTQTFNGQAIDISLAESAEELEQVVIIGYGTTTKKDATGSVTSVTSKDFNKGAIVTAENMINGKVAGVTINTSGAPGSGSQIRIRGGSSLDATNDPLIVIDGLPLTNNTGIGSTSALAAINPNDIESFTVLKDASATAIYGSRAANGVIIITTKKGSKDLKVNYKMTYGSGWNYNKVDVFSADEYRNIIATYRPNEVGQLGTANTDWQDAIYRRTDFVDNTASLTGNLFGFMPARISLGNTYQEGLRLTNKFNRSTVAVSLNPSFFQDHLRLTLNANYANEKNRFADGVEGGALRFDPTQPILDADSPYDGFFEYYNADGSLQQIAPRNPVAQLLQTHDNGSNDRFFGNFQVDYRLHFLPSLKATVNLGFDETTGERTRYVPSTAASAPSNNNVPYGTDEFSTRMLRNKLLDAYLNFNETFGKLNIDATAGYSYQKFEEESFYQGNLLNPTLPSTFPETDRVTDNVLIGFFGRVNFSFNDKYLLTFSYRRDGSSRFSEQNRWGNFPAAAFAWKLKEEFFNESTTLNDLKLRLGYGITGQQDLGSAARNFYLQQYTIGGGNSQYFFGAQPLFVGVPNAYNTDIKWEETTTYNAGIDYGLFDNRISGAVDVFYKKTTDLLSYVAFPDGSNFSNAGYQNIGDFSTKGIEFLIKGDVVRGQDFNWDVNFNFTKFERRIDELAFGQDIERGGTGAGTGSNVQLYREGVTPDAFYVYKQLYDTNGQPIEGAYADLNGDGIISGEDRYVYKNPDPDATFGFASNMTYKNWDFSFNMRASVGNRIFNGVNAGNAQLNLLRNGVLGNIPSSVTSTGFTTTADVVLSDIFIENGSYLRMDNITLGYTFQNWLEGKAQVRLFTGLQNAFIITEYSGLDPEITNNGRDQTIYPRQRQFLFGVNVNF